MTQVVRAGDRRGASSASRWPPACIAALPHFVGDVERAAAGRLRPDASSGAAGPGDRAARLDALLARAAAGHPAREAGAAAAAGHRLARQRFDWLKWTVTAAVAAALVGVAAWQAGSLTVGLVLSAGFVAVAVVLHVAGIILVRAVQPLRHARSFALRHAVLHVGRRGNQTRVILLAVGLGAFFILGVRTLQANLLRDFSVQVGDDAPGHVSDRRAAGAARSGRRAARRAERTGAGAAPDSGAARARRRRRRARAESRDLRTGAEAAAAWRASSR